MLSKAERDAMIAQYAEGYDVIMQSLEGITEAEWNAPEAPGEWCPRQVVHHLGDSEMIAAVAFRLMIATNDTPMIRYDADHLQRTLGEDRPVTDSLEAFRHVRRATLPLLEAMTDEEWAHVAHRPDGSQITCETMLTWYGPHAHKHAEQILRGRATVSGT